ncbi:MAG: YigZ family protein [Bacteroidales bacterium]|nr:YigZ family protein [Clostridium sp.]MCM1204140.1 YigZ family protein [Bacteroidales bacterium]
MIAEIRKMRRKTMLKRYVTVLEPGTEEIIEKKSRFIGYIRHVESEEEAAGFIASIKKKHYDARHNCYAYSVGKEQPLLKFSDDGEPSGTAGKPILEVITGQKLCDVCIVVTRYFGGTLLGTGGLVRAYTGAAKACIAATEVVTEQMVVPVTVTTDYTDLGKVQYLFGSEGIEISDSEYGEKVILHVEIFIDDVERMKKALTEATAGRAGFIQGDKGYSVIGEER